MNTNAFLDPASHAASMAQSSAAHTSPLPSPPRLPIYTTDHVRTMRPGLELHDDGPGPAPASTAEPLPPPPALPREERATEPPPRGMAPPRLVILESPYAGDVAANVAYARACLADCLARGEAPIASHLLYTQPGVLNDGVPDERARGIEAGLAWGRRADATVVYVGRGMSRGMEQGIARARAEGRPVELRTLPALSSLRAWAAEHLPPGSLSPAEPDPVRAAFVELLDALDAEPGPLASQGAHRARLVAAQRAGAQALGRVPA